MIIRLKCVMMDGTSPMSGDPLIPYAQDLVGASVDLPEVPAGVDVDFEFDFVGQDNAPFDMTGYTGFIACSHSIISTAPVFQNEIVFAGTSGTSFAAHAQTKDEKPRDCVYAVRVLRISDSHEQQPIPRSLLRIAPAVGKSAGSIESALPSRSLLELYVDPVDGDDSNPGTETEPLQTFQAAWNFRSIGLLGRRIHLVGGTFPVASAVSGKDVIFTVPPIQGELVSVVGTPVDSGLGTLTCTISANNSRDISSAPHAGTFVGAALKFTSGAAVGVRILIQADDGTTFTLCSSPEVLVPAVAPGDTFIVERPGSALQNVLGGINFSGGVLALKDVKFDMANGDALVFRDGCQCVCAQNVEASMNGAPFNVTNNAVFAPQSFGKLFEDQSLFDALSAFCGVYIHDGALRVNRGGTFGAAAGVSASAVIENASVVVNNGGKFVMDGGGLALIATDITVQKSLCVITGNDLARASSDGSTGDGLAALNGAEVELGTFDIKNAAGSGLLAYGGAKVAAGDLGGTGNGSLGIDIQGGSHVTADIDEMGVALTTITGTDGDLKVGDNDITTFAALTGGAGQGEGTTLNRFTMLGGVEPAVSAPPPNSFADITAVNPNLYTGQIAFDQLTGRLAFSYGSAWLYVAMEAP